MRRQSGEFAFPLIILTLCISIGITCRPPSAAAQTGSSWEEKYYNPQPAADDLILPLPCGGAMAFRQIEVPGTGWLDDRRIVLGQTDPELGYKEGRRFAYIAGAFTDPGNTSRRYYYLGKYEITVDQYAVFSGQCPQPATKGRLPVINVSWFDAIDFARRYSEWLLQNAREQLPQEGDQLGFLRLPTEEEWEFAARGGLTVDKTQFLAALFPMSEGELAEYVWYQSSDSAAGKLKPAGLLKPNPLGLHDMLGNAAEMVLAPFQLDHRGRLHGQAGGFISKGGDIFASLEQLRTAVREEHNYFDERTGKAKVLRTLGFRLVLTAPVLVSHDRLQQIQEEWRGLPDLMGNTGRDTRQALDALRTLAQNSQDSNVRAQLEDVQNQLEQSYSASNETRDRTLKALIRMGAFLGNKIEDADRRLRSIDKTIGIARADFATLTEKIAILKQNAAGQPNATELIAQADQALAQAQGKLDGMGRNYDQVKESLDTALSYYGDMVIEVADDYPMEVLEPQLAILNIEFTAKESQYLEHYAGFFIRHIGEYQTSGNADKAHWLEEILQ